MSSAPLRFWKYEGTANDFVVVEGGERASDLDAAWVRATCDRNRGVGGDGVILIAPASDPDHDARIVIRNSDGSRPEMCGNGVRCVGLHLAWRRASENRAPRAHLAIETDAGLRTVRVVGDDLASCAEVTVDMGRVVVGPTRTLDLAGVRFDVTAASAGNPHAVTFASLDDRTLDVIGAALQGSPQFPAGVNLERVAGVARDGEGRIGARVDVFERGVGRTMACGTGACAAAAVIVAKGRARVDEEITITLAGGRLAIAIDERGVATMRGAARRSFWGEIATSGVVEGSA